MFATGASEAMERRLVRGNIRDCFVIADAKSALIALVGVTARWRDSTHWERLAGLL